jgi:hypothetical protein
MIIQPGLLRKMALVTFGKAASADARAAIQRS